MQSAQVSRNEEAYHTVPAFTARDRTLIVFTLLEKMPHARPYSVAFALSMTCTLFTNWVYRKLLQKIRKKVDLLLILTAWWISFFTACSLTNYPLMLACHLHRWMGK